MAAAAATAQAAQAVATAAGATEVAGDVHRMARVFTLVYALAALGSCGGGCIALFCCCARRGPGSSYCFRVMRRATDAYKRELASMRGRPSDALRRRRGARAASYGDEEESDEEMRGAARLRHSTDAEAAHSELDGATASTITSVHVTFRGEPSSSRVLDVDLGRLAARPDAWLAHLILAQVASQLARVAVDPTDVSITYGDAAGRSRGLYLHSDASSVSELLRAPLVRIVVSLRAAKPRHARAPTCRAAPTARDETRTLQARTRCCSQPAFEWDSDEELSQTVEEEPTQYLI